MCVIKRERREIISNLEVVVDDAVDALLVDEVALAFAVEEVAIGMLLTPHGVRHHLVWK